MTFIPLGLNPHNGIQIDVDARIFLRHGGPGGAECWGVDGSTPWLEGIEAIVLRTDLTLGKEILWESETSYRRRVSRDGDEIEPGKRY